MLAVLRQIFEDDFPRIVSKATPDARLREDLGMDSMDITHLMVALEDRLGFRFDPDAHDIEDIFTDVAALERFILSEDASQGQARASAGL